MKFISMLIQISDIISGELNSEKSSLISALPQFPGELSETVEKAWFSSLKASVSSEKSRRIVNMERISMMKE